MASRSRVGLSNLMIVYMGLLLAGVAYCNQRIISVTLSRDSNFTANLDNYPIVSFTSSNVTECNNCCTFQPSYFTPNIPFIVQIGDDWITQDPWTFLNGTVIRNLQNKTLAVWLSGVNNTYTAASIDQSNANYGSSSSDILMTNSSSWDILGEETPLYNDTFDLDIARTQIETTMQYYILTNNGSSTAPRSYMVIFAVDINTAQIVPGTLIRNFSFSADYGVRTMYRPGLFCYVDNQIISFGSLDLSNGKITTSLSYNLVQLQLSLKDYFLCNDSQSVIVVENHRGVDIVSLTQYSNFMAPLTTKTWLTGVNTTIFVSSQGGLVLSIFNQVSSQLEVYYLGGNDYGSFSLVQVSFNGTSSIVTAEENNAMVFFSDADGFMYYYFKAIKSLAAMNYSEVQESHIRGYSYVDTNSTDLIQVFTFVNLGPYDGMDPQRVVPEYVGFTFSAVNSSIPEMQCQFSRPSGQFSSLEVVSLVTDYSISITWKDGDEPPQMSSIIKNILITGTVLLAMMLILGSFWLMSRKSKEEDAALEEFKLDYIKYSHKKPEHDDSSSLINHDIN